MHLNKSQRDVAQRLQRVIEFVRDHIQESITVAAAAKVACYSEFHFQRLFKEHLGESFGEYLTRKKLETAAIKIAYGQQVNITDIAHRYGYSSMSNFSKAFERFFGVRPSEMQKFLITPPSRRGKLQDKHRKLVNPEEVFTKDPLPDKESLQQRFKMVDDRTKIVTVDERKFRFLTSPRGYDLESINQLWVYLAKLLEDRGLDIMKLPRFAICHDHPGLFPASQCRYDACIEVPDDCEDLPLLTTTIPTGRYGIFRCEGPPEAVLEQYIEFATVWLPRSGYEPADFPTVDHLLPTEEAPFIQELWRKINIL